MRKFNVAVVGATGAVGEELFRVMEEVDFPVGELLPLASAKSAGTEIEFKGKNHKVVELTETVFDEHEIDIAFFSAGGSVSEKYAKFAAASGAVVIDNTSHFRMDADVPLVVPECNPQDIELWKETGIIAVENPRHHRQPKLLDHSNGANFKTARRRLRHQPRGRIDLSGGFGCWQRGHGGAGHAAAKVFRV